MKNSLLYTVGGIFAGYLISGFVKMAWDEQKDLSHIKLNTKKSATLTPIKSNFIDLEQDTQPKVHSIVNVPEYKNKQVFTKEDCSIFLGTLTGQFGKLADGSVVTGVESSNGFVNWELISTIK
jgi:hypothetical protein